MIVFQNDDIIIHELNNTKEIDIVQGATLHPQEGDLDKYSPECISAMKGKDYLWYGGYATEFDKNNMYVIEYLTGEHAGVGIDMKPTINVQYASLMYPTIEQNKGE